MEESKEASRTDDNNNNLESYVIIKSTIEGEEKPLRVDCQVNSTTGSNTDEIFNKIRSNNVALLNAVYKLLPLDFTKNTLIDQKEEILKNLETVLCYIENTCSSRPDKSLFCIQPDNEMITKKELFVFDIGYTESDGCLVFNPDTSSLQARIFYNDQRDSFVEMVQLIKQLGPKSEKNAIEMINRLEESIFVISKHDESLMVDEDLVVTDNDVTSVECPVQKSEAFKSIENNKAYELLSVKYTEEAMIKAKPELMDDLKNIMNCIQNTCAASPNTRFFRISKQDRLMKYKDFLEYEVGYDKVDDCLEFDSRNLAAKAQSSQFLKTHLKDFEELVELVKRLGTKQEEIPPEPDHSSIQSSKEESTEDLFEKTTLEEVVEDFCVNDEDVLEKFQNDRFVLNNQKYKLLPANCTIESIIESKGEILDDLALILKYVYGVTALDPEENILNFKIDQRLMRYKDIFIEAGFTENDGVFSYKKRGLFEIDFNEEPSSESVSNVNLLPSLAIDEIKTTNQSDLTESAPNISLNQAKQEAVEPPKQATKKLEPPKQVTEAVEQPKQATEKAKPPKQEINYRDTASYFLTHFFYAAIVYYACIFFLNLIKN